MDQTAEFVELIEKKPSHSKKVLSLFNNFLFRKYPGFVTSEHFPVKEVCTGQMWPNVIKLFSKCCVILIIVYSLCHFVVIIMVTKSTDHFYLLLKKLILAL